MKALMCILSAMLLVCLTMPLSTSATSRINLAQEKSTTLAEARTKWKSHHISDYEMLYDQVCGCVIPSDVETMVRANRVVMVFDRERKKWVKAKFLRYYQKVEQLFDQIERIKRPQEQGRFEVEYDPEYGNPTRVFVDLDKSSVDEELQYNI